jgi:hypothetical protein
MVAQQRMPVQRTTASHALASPGRCAALRGLAVGRAWRCGCGCRRRPGRARPPAPAPPPRRRDVSLVTTVWRGGGEQDDDGRQTRIISPLGPRRPRAACGPSARPPPLLLTLSSRLSSGQGGGGGGQRDGRARAAAGR